MIKRGNLQYYWILLLLSFRIDWKLNPEPFACKTNVIPITDELTSPYDKLVINKYTFHLCIFYWIDRELNPGPFACKANVIPLHHQPMNGFLLSFNLAMGINWITNYLKLATTMLFDDYIVIDGISFVEA